MIGAYGISKAADMQLARNLAVEYGPHNIRVNCIAPGLIRTDFARALWEDEALLAKRTATTPLRCIGEPDEIAGVAVFLASSAGSFVTGQSPHHPACIRAVMILGKIKSSRTAVRAGCSVAQAPVPSIRRQALHAVVVDEVLVLQLDALPCLG